MQEIPGIRFDGSQGEPFYPPTQKATPACRNALRRAGTGLQTVDEWRGEGTLRSSKGA